MASTAIANRLILNSTNKLISETQTAFITGRFISKNARIVYDIMHYLEEKKQQGLLMLVDFQKAFDSISRDFFVRCALYFKHLDKILKADRCFK